MPEGRYHRQELLFGREGQAKLEACKVGIVGLGGLGSHVAQQLAYLGVLSYVLVDNDRVSESNLNRLVGACDEDANICRLKVDVADELIRTVLPTASVTKLPLTFISIEGYSRLRGVDFVFGCVDNDPSRLILNEFCQAYGIRYIDLATDIDPKDESFGGRVLFADGRTCVVCKGALDDNALRAAFSTDEQREEDERIYGVARGALGATGPAVVSLNGIIASLAVTEFMVEVTGLREANIYLEYRGALGAVWRSLDQATPDCYYCQTVRGRGIQADTERYIREGWGEKAHFVTALGTPGLNVRGSHPSLQRCQLDRDFQRELDSFSTSPGVQK